MRTPLVSLIYNPKQVGSMTTIANSILSDCAIKTALEENGYKVRQIEPDELRFLLEDKPIGIGCYVLGGNSDLMEARKERAIQNLVRLLPEYEEELKVDPIGIVIGKPH